MKVHIRIIILLCSMIFVVACILSISVYLSVGEMRQSGNNMSMELELYAEENVRQELHNLVSNISDYIIALEAEIDRSMLNAALVLYELDRLSEGMLTLDELVDLKERTGMSDLYIGDLDGVFTLSTEPEAIGISLFDIWDGYRALVTGETNYMPGDLTVKAETGEIFKFTAISRADNRGVLESALDASIIENYLQHMIDNSRSIQTINLFNMHLMTLTSNSAQGATPVYIKGENVQNEASNIAAFFNGETQIQITMDRQSAHIYFPVIEDSGRVRYVLFIDIDTTGYFSMQNLVESSIVDLVSQSVFLKIFSLVTVFAVLLVFTVVISIITSRLVRHLEEANIAAAASNKAKSSFLSAMSHEIRTPMNAILGITEIQLQNNKLDENVREGFEKIHSSGSMLLSLINDILDLSKIEAEKLELVIANYEMASLISDTVQLNIMRIGKKPIKFEVFVDSNVPQRLQGDELRIKQVLNNFLSNAFKYSDSGIVKMSVFAEDGSNSKEPQTASTEPQSSYTTLKFVISDSGQGMSQDQVSKLFEDYSRFNMEANRSTEGAGLGMSITKNLVEMMDGSIHVESEPGKGSVFTVYFPQVKLGDEVLSEEVINNLQQYSSVNMSQSKRIQITHEPMPYGSVLIVDDTETNIFVASGLMEPYRLKVDSSDSGFSAVDKVKSGIIYDIIFMDHMMPEMDGMEATTLIREMGYTAPIVALTANAVAGQAEIFLANGFDAFISKPIDTRALDNVLCELIRDKQTPDVLEAARKQYIDGYGDADSSDSDSSNADSGDSDSVAQTSAPTEPAISPQYAKVIIRDAAKAIESLQLVHDKRETPDLCSEEEIRMLTINVHAMKSVMANIGESSISEMAFRMEKAGNQGDINAILADTEVLINDIKAVIERIKPEEDEAVEEVSQEDMEFLREKLTAIKDACDFYDAKTAKNEIAALKEKKWPQATNDIIESITEHLLHGDYEEAATTAGEYIT